MYSFLTLSQEHEIFPEAHGMGRGGLVAKSCPILVTPWTVACQAPLASSPGKNTGVGCYFLLQLDSYELIKE